MSRSLSLPLSLSISISASYFENNVQENRKNAVEKDTHPWTYQPEAHIWVLMDAGK